MRAPVGVVPGFVGSPKKRKCHGGETEEGMDQSVLVHGIRKHRLGAAEMQIAGDLLLQVLAK